MMMFSSFDQNDPEQNDRFRELFGPHQVDQQIRSAIQTCWMGLPAGKKNVENVEEQIRRIVDRTLRDLREDAGAFGFGADD